MPRRAPGRSAQAATGPPVSNREAELEARLAERERELTDALEQQTVTSEVLQVISQSPTDLERVLNTIASSSARLTRSRSVSIRLLEGGEARVGAGLLEVANHGTAMDVPAGSHVTAPAAVPPLGTRETVRTGAVTGRAVLERRLIHVPNMLDLPEAEFPDSVAAARSHGNRSMLVAPLLRGESALGVIVARRWEVVPFGDREIRLLATFADQAVIAIENARLFSELQERLEEQTATSQVLRAISQSPTNVQPVLDAIVESAVRLWRADEARLRRLEGDWLVPVAGFDRATVASGRRPVPAQPTSVAGRALSAGRVLHLTDTRAQVTEGEGYGPEEVSLFANAGYPVVLAVPLLREGGPIGSLAIFRRRDLGPFAERQIQLLRTFADQAVIAIENSRLFSELQQRTEQLTRSVERLTALFEVGQAVGGTLDLDRLLEIVVARASDLAGADGGAVYEYDPELGAFELRATHRMGEQFVAAIRQARIRLGETVVGRAAAERAPVQFADVRAEEADARTRATLELAGYRAVLSVPLLRDRVVVGVLVVRRRSPGAFDPDTVAVLQTFANQSALAIQNARLFAEIERKSRQLEEASQHKSEFLANMSHELRTPLNAIIGFTEVLLERYFGEVNEKQEDYLKDVLSSGQHLLSLINDILDLSKVEAGRMELELGTFDLEHALEASLVMVRERASRKGIELSLDAAQDVGRVEADERKVKQVLFNLVTNAVKFTPAGGKVSVSARRRDERVEVAVADTGIGIAPEEQARVFEEFGQARSAVGQDEGTGLGLALCKRFVELHGGSIRLASSPGRGSTFTVALPVRQAGRPVDRPGST